MAKEEGRKPGDTKQRGPGGRTLSEDGVPRREQPAHSPLKQRDETRVQRQDPGPTKPPSRKGT